MAALLLHFKQGIIEAGCDEAGRGCIAGPVFAAAVILPEGFSSDLITDSKMLSDKKRRTLRPIIEKEAIAWAVGSVSNQEIDRINILNASFLAMHRAIEQLVKKPELLLIDGNRFTPYLETPHQCIVKGDSKYLSIAAASILAKTYRDDYMENLHLKYPVYNWNENKGYPTPFHKKAVMQLGITPYHRKSYNLNFQYKLPL